MIRTFREWYWRLVASYGSALGTIAICMLLIPGCAPYQPPPQPPSVLGHNDTEYVVMIVMDLSGSFADLMTDQGKGYNFAMAVYNDYFASRVGSTKDKLIIAQLSGNDRSLVWQGTPLQLRQQFNDSSAFKTHLKSKADPRGSVIYDGLAHAIEQMMLDRAVSSGRAKTAVFVLSDMDDNASQPGGLQRLEKALADYARVKGVVGMWFVDQQHTKFWNDTLPRCGITDYLVLPYEENKPSLPKI